MFTNETSLQNYESQSNYCVIFYSFNCVIYLYIFINVRYMKND